MPTKISLEGAFYPAYKELNPKIPEATFRCAEEVVQELVDHATTSEHPGMLLGKVQSGKTRTFICSMALAFDNGYDIAIVLSKNSKALIEQTRKRLETEFKPFLEDEEMAVYDIMSAPTSFSAYELESKLVLVAKKQDDNLSRLIKLFKKNPAMGRKRTLIIDDEADSASIGFAKKDGEIEARKIATQVSALRSAIESCSFLQVTATPYSLYLQPSVVEVPNVLEYKPIRPQFTKLVPVAPDYVGGEAYFGEPSQTPGRVENFIHHPVDHNEFDRLKRPDGRSFKLDDVLVAPQISGYRAAIVNFLVGGSIQRLNGQAAGSKVKKLQYSFLLHSEAGRDAHNWQETLTTALVEKLAQAAREGAPIYLGLVLAAHADLSRSLAIAGLPIPSVGEVQEALGRLLETEAVTITKVNSDEDVAALLDSSGQLRLRTPFNIFLGGQVLDRGVTLANLIGFYYGRRPNKFQQDTVLQHSRMYGFRQPDLAVTRFYTSPGIRHAMSQMEEFDSSLRSTIAAGGDRAVQFIRTATDGRIVPCSPNKILLASTQTIRARKRILPLGFQSGFPTGDHGIRKVVERIDAMVEDAGGFGADKPSLVPVETALAFLEAIQETLVFDEEETPAFDWGAAMAALTHLSAQHQDPDKRGKVWLQAERGRDMARYIAHGVFADAPDSKGEERIAQAFAVDHPILFLLRQEGSKEKGWRGTPFYWPVIRAQANAPTAIYTSETSN